MSDAAADDHWDSIPTRLPRREADCDRFEAAWRTGQPPRIEDFWTNRADRALFADLLALDLSYRLRRGEQPAAHEYGTRFPDENAAIRAAFAALAAPAPSGGRPAPMRGPARADSDRNLLFGVLALQVGFVSREALIAAVSVWVQDRSKPLDQVLVEQGTLTADEQALLEPLIRRQLERHGGDPEQSLAGVTDQGLATSLRVLADSGSAETLDAVRTAVPVPASVSVGTVSSSGLRFRILRPLAHGGLGEVFVARDEELRREVALKAIQEHCSTDPQSLYRFQLEAEITGRLEHPGIIPVYGLGQYDDGRPFYAMRLIRGESLKDAIARFHGEGQFRRDPRERALALRALLRRFVDVCNAIDYAHSRGVLHRDLKPANVMLGPYGETLVVDWGLAKAAGRPENLPRTEDGTLRPESASASDSTLPGAQLGTPTFMSPEQAAGQIDQLGPASDVYSLGATLYNLLTGRFPFAGSDVFAVLEKVQRGEFAPPRSINREVPPALDAICRKAMALAVADRYPSPRALADEIERWLADEAVSAYREPPTVWLARWGRRHRPLVAGLTALFVTVLAALAASTVLIGRESARREAQRQRAEENFTRAREAVDQMLTEVAEVELADVPHMQSVRKTLLEKARQFYREFLDQKSNDPAVRREAGRSHLRLGEIDRLLGDDLAAEQAFRQGIAILEALVRDDAAGRDARRDLAMGEDGLGMLLKKAHRFKESEALLRDAMRLREQLAGADPPIAADRQALADTRYHLAVLFTRLQGRHAEDEAAYREAVRMQGALVAQARDHPEHRRKLARYLNNLGLLLAATSRSGEAENDYREAIAILHSLVAALPPVPGDRWQLARSSSNLAVLLQATGRREEAEALSRSALDLQRALRADFPDVPDYRHELASILNNIGLLRQSSGRLQEAEQAYREALELQDTLVAEFPHSADYRQGLAVMRLNLASALEQRDVAQAKRTYHEALTLQERLTAEFPDVSEYRSTLGRTLYSLARLHVVSGEFETARALLARAITYHRALLADDSRSSSIRAFLRDDYGVLCQALIRSGAIAAAADSAEELPRIIPDAAQEYLRGAEYLAECATLAKAATATATSTEPEDHAEAYSRRGIDLLRRAIERGVLRDPAALQDQKLAPLRARTDFQELGRKLQDLSRIRAG
jgi:serine/threonine-protein kinase